MPIQTVPAWRVSIITSFTMPFCRWRTALPSTKSGHDGQWARVDHNMIYDIGGIPNGYLYAGIYLDYAPNEGNAPGRYIFDHNVIYNVSLPMQINPSQHSACGEQYLN